MTKPLSPVLLHTYLTENPSQAAKCHRIKSQLYQIATVISLIVAVAIFGMNIAAYCGLMNAAPISFSQLGCAFLKSLFIAFNSIQFSYDSSKHMHLEKKNELIHAHLQTIQKWDDHQICQFYQAKGRSIEKLPAETLAKIKQINPKHPHIALLPLIARYQVSEAFGKKWDEGYTKLEKFRKEVEQDCKLTPAEKKGKLTRNHQIFLENKVLGEVLFYQPLHEQSAQFLGLPNELAKKSKRVAQSCIGHITFSGKREVLQSLVT